MRLGCFQAMREKVFEFLLMLGNVGQGHQPGFGGIEGASHLEVTIVLGAFGIRWDEVIENEAADEDVAVDNGKAIAVKNGLADMELWGGRGRGHFNRFCS